MEIQAAVGRSQLLDLEKFVERRRLIASRVQDAIAGSGMSIIGNERLLDDESRASHSWMLIPIRVSGQGAQQRRERILNFLTQCGVETRPVLTGNFVAQPAVQRIFRQSLNSDSYANASLISQTSFLVGAHHDLNDEQVNHLCRSLTLAGEV
jgi:CDP-6-deoxy-D-xylo-4-hexulose-3-dehydrase